MRRLFWMTLGATVGVLAVRRATRAVEALTPPALARSLSEAVSELAHAIGEFAVDVREGMAEREAELRADLGLTDPGRPVLDAALRRRRQDGRHPGLAGGPADRRSLPTPRTGRHA